MICKILIINFKKSFTLLYAAKDKAGGGCDSISTVTVPTVVVIRSIFNSTIKTRITTMWYYNKQKSNYTFGCFQGYGTVGLFTVCILFVVIV